MRFSAPQPRPTPVVDGIQVGVALLTKAALHPEECSSEELNAVKTVCSDDSRIGEEVAYLQANREILIGAPQNMGDD